MLCGDAAALKPPTTHSTLPFGLRQHTETTIQSTTEVFLMWVAGDASDG